MDNMQTRLLSGVWTDLGFGECDEETLTLAKQNLRERFCVVGLTERFDETLLLLKRALGWRNVNYVRHNVTRGRPRRTSVDAETLSVLQASNQLDIQLYAYAKTLLADKIRAQGPSFSRELMAFRFSNDLLQPLGRAYWRVRRFSVRAWLKDRLGRTATA
jgi:hypothetical protein